MHTHTHPEKTPNQNPQNLRILETQKRYKILQVLSCDFLLLEGHQLYDSTC